MNEYGLLDAFNQHLGTTVSFFVSYISATSAFLVVAYLAGKQLPPIVAKLAIGLYSLTAVFFMALFQRHWTSLMSVRDKMHDMDLSWYPAVYESQWFMPITMWIGVMVMAVLYAGSVWYFISARRDTDGGT